MDVFVVCSRCRESKPSTEYYKRYTQCKKCTLAANRAYTQTPEGKAASRRCRQRYDATASGKAKYRHYRQSAKGKIVLFNDAARRRARAGTWSNYLRSSDWQEILEKHNHSCAYCLVSIENLTKDHVIPLSRGGMHSKDNIVPACKSCNSRKHNKTVTEWMAR